MQHFNSFPGNKQHKFQPSQQASKTHFCWAESNFPQPPPSQSKLQPSGFFHEITHLNFLRENAEDLHEIHVALPKKKKKKKTGRTRL